MDRREFCCALFAFLTHAPGTVEGRNGIAILPGVGQELEEVITSDNSGGDDIIQRSHVVVGVDAETFGFALEQKLCENENKGGERRRKQKIPFFHQERAKKRRRRDERSHWPSHLQIRLDRLQNSCHFGQRAILRATSVSGEWDSFVIQESTSKGLLGTSKVPLLAGRESTWKSRRKEDVVGEVSMKRFEKRKSEKV